MDRETAVVIILGLLALVAGLTIRLWEATSTPCVVLPAAVRVQTWEDGSSRVIVGQYMFRIDAETGEVTQTR